MSIAGEYGLMETNICVSIAQDVRYPLDVIYNAMNDEW